MNTKEIVAEIKNQKILGAKRIRVVFTSNQGKYVINMGEFEPAFAFGKNGNVLSHITNFINEGSKGATGFHIVVITPPAQGDAAHS